MNISESMTVIIELDTNLECPNGAERFDVRMKFLGLEMCTEKRELLEQKYVILHNSGQCCNDDGFSTAVSQAHTCKTSCAL